MTLLGSPIGGDGLSLSFTPDGPLVLVDGRDRSAREIASGMTDAGLVFLLIEPATPPAVFGDEASDREKALAAAVALLGLESLRDLSITDLLRARDALDGRSYRLVRHVVTENQRVRDAVRMLRDEGPVGLGDLLFESHRSIRDDLSASRPELDLAVEIAQNYGALGGRLTGSGDSLAAVALVPIALLSQVQVSIDSAFAEHGLAQPEMFTARPAG